MTLLPIKTLESTFNRYLSLDSDSSKLLAPLIGKVMGIHIQRPKIAIYFSFNESRVQLSTEAPETINTEIYTTLFQLMRLKLNKSSSLINAQLLLKPAGFLKTNKEKMAQDVTEYCQEEIMILPSNNEVEIFRRNVDDLRLQTDRLEAKIELLKNKIC